MLSNKAYLEEYSMKMGENLRGVMVIKTKDKSRASQRKGAVANWKKTGKTVNKYLKKRRITGDDLGGHSIKNVVQLNSVDGDVYQSLLLKPSLGQFGPNKWAD